MLLVSTAELSGQSRHCKRVAAQVACRELVVQLGRPETVPPGRPGICVSAFIGEGPIAAAADKGISEIGDMAGFERRWRHSCGVPMSSLDKRPLCATGIDSGLAMSFGGALSVFHAMLCRADRSNQ